MANGDYFDMYFPKSDVSSSDRFFFFNSLKETELGSAVESVLGSHAAQINFKEKDSEGFRIIQNAMDFLKRMIEAEQGSEREYFTINILNNSKLPQQLRDDCKKAIGGTTINYKDFINLINEYYDGALAYKKSLNFEIHRLSELEKLYRKFEKHYNANEDGTYTINTFDKKNQRMEQKDVNYYAAFSNFLQVGLKKGWLTKEEQDFGFNTKTLANTIQAEFKSLFNQLWKSIDFREKILPYVMNNGLANFQKEFTSELILNFTKMATPVIIDMLNNQNTNLYYKLSGENKQALVKQFIAKIESMPGKSAKEKIESSEIYDLMKGYSELMSQSERLKYGNDRIIRAYDEKTQVSANNNGGLDNLGPEIIDLLQTVLNNRQKTSVSNTIAWGREEVYKALLESFPKEGLKVKGKYDWNKMANIINQQLENQPLITVNIAAKDNIVSESINRIGISQAILQDGRIGETILTFGTQKADVSGIEIAQVKINQGNIPWKKIANTITQSFINTLNIQDSNIDTSNLSFDETAFRKTNHFSAKEFSIEAETMRRLAIKEQELINVRKILEKAKIKTTEIEQILSALKNNVQIGSTVKSYNKYDSSKGFHGGSLGGTVENQINNIYKLFEYGGLNSGDLPDKEWLIFTIYNSGTALMGSQYKEPIEHFLTTAAVMLMFDDVGQQAVYLNQQIREKYHLDANNSSKFLHLYYLNGTYYPSSFILQLTYNKLTEIFSILQLDKLSGTSAFDKISNGSHAEIVNPVNRALQVGEHYKQGKKEKIVTAQEQWSQTFNYNKKSVSVNITFLAGMLDIIKILNANL